MDIQKISNFWNLDYLRDLRAQNSAANFSTKKFIETQNRTQAAWSPLFCRFLTYHANFEVS